MIGLDLSNARLVAWTEEGDERRAAVRNHRVSPWRLAGDTKYHYRSTEEIQGFAEAGTDHYIEDFPALTLVEVVGDAKVFTANSAGGRPCICWLDERRDVWWRADIFGGTPAYFDLESPDIIFDPATVMPYHPTGDQS